VHIWLDLLVCQSRGAGLAPHGDIQPPSHSESQHFGAGICTGLGGYAPELWELSDFPGEVVHNSQGW
jgi:hypothetical protein